MIVFVQYRDGHRVFYRLNISGDYARLIEDFPRCRRIILSSNGIKSAAVAVARYINQHSMLSAWVEDTDISKGIKDIAVALGIAGAAATLTPTTPIEHKQHHQQQTDDLGKQPEDAFLWNIMQLESSGGRNIDHKKYNLPYPVIGRWGMKKPTINEILDRVDRKGGLPQPLQIIRDMDRDTTAEYLLNNPQIELDLARTLARHVLKRQRGDQYKAAYAWRHGHNLFPNDIPFDNIQGSGYINKFKVLQQRNPYISRPTPSFEKNEKGVDFRSRVETWIKERRLKHNESLPRDHTFNPDPGRLRDDKALDRPDSEWKDDVQRLRNRYRDSYQQLERAGDEDKE